MHCNCLKEKGKLAFAWSFSHTHTTQWIAGTHPCLRSAPDLLCQEGFAHFRRVGPALLQAPPAARARPCSLCHLPVPSQTARPGCPPLTAPTACPLCSPNLPLQLTFGNRCNFPCSVHLLLAELWSSLCSALQVLGPDRGWGAWTHPQP